MHYIRLLSFNANNEQVNSQAIVIAVTTDWLVGWLVGWDLTALSAQIGHILP